MRKYILLTIMVSILFIIFFQVKDPYLINNKAALELVTSHHWFGTDYLGRDLFSRIIYGSINSIMLAFISLVSVIIISLIFGGLSGLLGGLVDGVITIFADMLISIPSLILTLVFTSLFSNTVITVLIALTISWSGKYIRYIRNLVLNVSKEEFIFLSPLRGSYGKDMLIHHILPNIFIDLCSLFLTDIGKLVLSISGLSFLGIGVHPPIPELGTILFDGKEYFFNAPWIFVIPGIMLCVIVLSTQYLGNYFRDKQREYYD